MTLISSKMIKPDDRKLSRSQLNEVIRLSKQQRIGPQIQTDEIQVQPQADMNGGSYNFESIPVLYKLVDIESESSSSSSGHDPYTRARKVALDGTVSGSIFRFPTLQE